MRRFSLVILLAAAIAAPATAQDPTPTPTPVPENPCLTERAAVLLCPDLVMRAPFDLELDRKTRRGRHLLRAANSIDNMGEGPAELYGVRVSRTYMDGRQRIYRRSGGSRLSIDTGARIVFKFIPGQRSYWKFENAAAFELWRINSQGARTRLVRTGPKVSYCLRDLKHTHPHLRRSPRSEVYPGCSTNPRERRRRLGTSVGFSDVYPHGYHEQWIDVTRLRGCHAYVHKADPLNHLYESDETNNEAQVIVRLPYRPGRQDCPGAKPIAAPDHEDEEY